VQWRPEKKKTRKQENKENKKTRKQENKKGEGD
jgi:hypothetical protein